MINCAHPTHFEAVLERRAVGRADPRRCAPTRRRKSHAELDEAEELDSGDPDDLGARYAALRDAAARPQRARRLLRHRPPPRGGDLRRLAGRRLGLGALHRHARQRAVQPARQPPVAVADQVHHRGHEHVRRMNASRNTALARPMPNSAITRWPASRNEPKTKIMIVAAAVITRPVAACPIRTEWPLSCGAHPLLVHAADQEHLVVHREPEQDREHHHRQERLDRPGADAERPGEEALLEDQR